MLSNYHQLWERSQHAPPHVAASAYRDDHTLPGHETYATSLHLHEFDGKDAATGLPGVYIEGLNSCTPKLQTRPYVWVSQRELRHLDPIDRPLVRQHMDLLPKVKYDERRKIQLDKAKEVDNETRDQLAHNRVWMTTSMVANRDAVLPLVKKYVDAKYEPRADMVTYHPPSITHDNRGVWKEAKERNFDRWLNRGKLSGPTEYVRPPRDETHLETQAKEQVYKSKCIKGWLESDSLKEPYKRPLPRYAGHVPRGPITEMIKPKEQDHMTSVYAHSYGRYPPEGYPRMDHPRQNWFKRDVLS